MNNDGGKELSVPPGHRLTPIGDRAPLRILMAPADYDYPGFSADVAARRRSRPFHSLSNG
jgi:hypothetical protein